MHPCMYVYMPVHFPFYLATHAPTKACSGTLVQALWGYFAFPSLFTSCLLCVCSRQPCIHVNMSFCFFTFYLATHEPSKACGGTWAQAIWGHPDLQCQFISYIVCVYFRHPMIYVNGHVYANCIGLILSPSRALIGTLVHALWEGAALSFQCVPLIVLSTLLAPIQLWHSARAFLI